MMEGKISAVNVLCNWCIDVIWVCAYTGSVFDESEVESEEGNAA